MMRYTVSGYWTDPEGNWVRHDDAQAAIEAARREERERCKGIAEQWGRYHNDLWNESRLDPKKVGQRPYYDGASDCAHEIANEICEG